MQIKCQKCQNGYGLHPFEGKKLCRRCWRETMGVEVHKCAMCKRLKQPCMSHCGEVKISDQTMLADLQASMRRHEK